jgi:hypothetical protein
MWTDHHFLAKVSEYVTYQVSPLRELRKPIDPAVGYGINLMDVYFVISDAQKISMKFYSIIFLHLPKSSL